MPITIMKKDNGNYNYSMSSGGLVSGLSGMTKTTTFSWFGWPGLEVPEGDIAKVEEELKEQYNAVPIWLPDEMADRHCEEFPLVVLWWHFWQKKGKKSTNVSRQRLFE